MVIILSTIAVVIDLSQKLGRLEDNGSTPMEALIQFYPYWAVWLVNTFSASCGFYFSNLFYFSFDYANRNSCAKREELAFIELQNLIVCCRAMLYPLCLSIILLCLGQTSKE